MNQTIKLDTRKCDGAYGKARIATLRRGERNNALLTVKVCANGQPYDLAGKTASLVATTAAGKLVGPCPMEVADAGIARIMLPAALYSAVGSFSGYVEIREGETLVDTTDRFGGKVIECADLDSEQAAEFTPLLGELQNAVAEEAKRVEDEKDRAQAETERETGFAEAKQAAQTATTAANDAAAGARSAAGSASDAAESANTAAGKATDAAGLAETAKTNANTAAEEANAAATKAEAAARKADSAAETAVTAASTAELAANKADTAAVNAESMAEKADASSNKADTAAGKANEATVAAINAATKANEVEAKLTGNILKGNVKGTFIHVDDAFATSLCGLTVYGKSTQDGTPTPDAPVPIVSTGDDGSVVVKVTGKNLFNHGVDEHITATSEGLILDGKITQNIMLTIPLLAGTYTFGDFTQKTVVHSYINNNDGFITNTVTKVITATDKVMLYIERGTYSKELVKPYIVHGKAAPQSYEPYREQLLTLPTPTGLHGIPVKSGGNYTDSNGQQWICDEVDLERGVKVQRVKVLNLFNSGGFNNGGTWHINTRYFGAGTSYIPMKWYDNIVKCLCNTFPVQMSNYSTSSSSDLSLYYSATGDIISLNAALFNPEGQLATVDEANAWFTAHPTYLYVPIEPIETPLTPAEIAAYKALTTYGPDTVVQTVDGAEVKLKYHRDVNIVVANLESAIASITQG